MCLGVGRAQGIVFNVCPQQVSSKHLHSAESDLLPTYPHIVPSLPAQDLYASPHDVAWEASYHHSHPHFGSPSSQVDYQEDLVVAFPRRVPCRLTFG